MAKHLGEPSPATHPPEDPSLIVVDFAKPLLPLTWLALFVGGILIASSIFGPKWIDIAPHYGNVMVGSGVAIILAAFGGQAAVRGKGYVFAGVGGIALGLIFLLNFEGHKFNEESIKKLELLKNSYLTGRINGLPVKQYDVKLVVEDFVRSKHQDSFQRFDFVIFKSELDRSGPASLDIVDKRDERASMNFSIDKSCLVGSLGKDEPVTWVFDATKKAIIDQKTGMDIALFDLPPQVRKCQTASDHAGIVDEGSGSSGWISTAFAAEEPTKTEMARPPTRKMLDEALADIQSGDTDVRRSARIVLSHGEPEDVAYILAYLRKELQRDPNIYRTKLGISLALTEMLRRDKSLRDRMSFDQADLEMLLDFAGSEDRNLRIYSGEFLYDLESPDVTKLALPRAVNAPSDDARYNWILVSKGGWLKLSKKDKAPLLPIIKQLRVDTKAKPKTADLLDFFEKRS